MSDDGASPEELRARIDHLRQRVEGPVKLPQSEGKAAAMRIATDIMVCIGVGIFLGYWGDRWLGSQPWGAMLGIAFGMAAGVRSAIRSAQAMENDEKKSI